MPQMLATEYSLGMSVSATPRRAWSSCATLLSLAIYKLKVLNVHVKLHVSGMFKLCMQMFLAVSYVKASAAVFLPLIPGFV